MLQLNEVWAKTNPFQSIVTHGLVSGFVAQFLMEEYLCEGTKKQLAEELNLKQEDLISFTGYFVSLHDIGKISKRFQNDEHDKFNNIRHEKTSFRALMRIWTKEYGINRRIARPFGEIIQAHHQGKSGFEDDCDNEWQALQDEFEKLMADSFCFNRLSFPVPATEMQGIYEAILLGILILSDWLASGNMFTDAEQWQNDSVMENVWEKMKTFSKESGLQPVKKSYGTSFSDVWPNIPAGKERELQKLSQKIFEDEKRYSMILMEAPMGEGKTEAAVYAASRMAEQWGKDGFYIGLPTSATSNQMLTRMNDFFALHNADTAVRLLHSQAWLIEDEALYNSEDEKYICQWLLPGRRAMLSQYAVGTVDQAMMAAMCVRYGVLRLLGLTEKVLIIDEIHAYDMYMMNILKGLLVWCRALQIPVILLSATLPVSRKKEIFGIFTNEEAETVYPCITAIDERGAIKSLHIGAVAKKMEYKVEIKPILHSYSDIARLALAQVSEGGCCCVLMNTVRQAQSVYSEIRSMDSSIDTMLFHSRFLNKDRNDIEKRCIAKYGKNSKERPARSILVATQVVEQSLDVDFDYMITSIAPIDLILQRMGRQFRHEDTLRPHGLEQPTIIVITPEKDDYGQDSYVYDRCVLRQSEYILKKHKTIRIPEDVEQMVNACYDISCVPPENAEEWKAYETDISDKEALSDKFKLNDPSQKFLPLYADAEFDDGENSNCQKSLRVSYLLQQASKDFRQVSMVRHHIFL